MDKEKAAKFLDATCPIALSSVFLSLCSELYKCRVQWCGAESREPSSSLEVR